MPAPVAPPAPASVSPILLANDLKRAWRAGAPPDVGAALLEYPELLGHRSVVVDLAYEDYCLREEAGHAPDPEAFCRDLPAYRSQVREVLRGHRLVADHPELFESREPAWPAPGDRSAGLTVVQELGRGAFARAYLARDPDTGDQPVVLKLSPTASGEARTLGPVRHPHVVGVHWARHVDGLFAICLPFVGAATLRDGIDAAFDPAVGRRRSARTMLDAIDRATGPLPESPDPAPPLIDGRQSYPEAVAAIGRRLAGALAHLHRLGVAHGDLKPSNILLGPGGHPYLIDFNLAARADDSLLQCGGTLPYMAPERIRVLLGDSKDPGPADRADVYSFGAVLFEALTGRLPIEPIGSPDQTEVAAGLLARSTAGAPRAPGVPRPLARLIERCLEADPTRRPAAEELERGLDRYLRWRPRRSRVFSALGAVILAGIAVWHLAGNRPPGPATPDEFFARGVAFLRDGDVASAMRDFDTARRARPDGRSMAYQAYCRSRSGDHTGAAALYTQARVAGYDAAWLTNNVSYSLIKSAKGPDQFRRPVEEATAAIRSDPGLRAAYLNRAWAWYQWKLDRKARVLSDPGECVADINRALAGGPRTADVCYMAALILATSGDESHLPGAVNWLGEAVRLGKEPRLIAGDPVLKARLGRRQDFQQVLRLPPAAQPESAPDLQLADPPGN